MLVKTNVRNGQACQPQPARLPEQPAHGRVHRRAHEEHRQQEDTRA